MKACQRDLLAFVALLELTTVLASVYPTQPIADTVFMSGHLAHIYWKDDGWTPHLKDMGLMNIDLYVNPVGSDMIQMNTGVSNLNFENASPWCGRGLCCLSYIDMFLLITPALRYNAGERRGSHYPFTHSHNPVKFASERFFLVSSRSRNCKPLTPACSASCTSNLHLHIHIGTQNHINIRLHVHTHTQLFTPPTFRLHL